MIMFNIYIYILHIGEGKAPLVEAAGMFERCSVFCLVIRIDVQCMTSQMSQLLCTHSSN